MINKPFIVLVRLYQKFISPFLPGACRFYPSCSQYCVEALQTYNLIHALYLSTKRILRCNPHSEGYFDPLPRKNKEKKRSN